MSSEGSKRYLYDVGELVKFKTVNHWENRLDGDWDERNTNAYNCVGIFKRWLVWLDENGGKFAGMTPDELMAFQRNARKDESFYKSKYHWIKS